MADTPNRRSLLGALAVAPVVAASVTTRPYAGLLQQGSSSDMNMHRTPVLATASAASTLPPRIAAFKSRTDYMNAHVTDDGTWDRWAEDQSTLLAEVEALPLTVENAGIRAQAIAMIHLGEEHLPSMFDNDPATDGRLTIQIIRSLAADDTGHLAKLEG